MIDSNAINPKLLLVNHIGRGNMPTDTHTFGKRITRWHELDIITWGEGTDYVNGRSYSVTGGDIFYRVPGMVNKHDLPYHCYFFVFDPCYDPTREPAYEMDSTNGSEITDSSSWNPIALLPFNSNPYLGKATNLERLSVMSMNLFMEFTSNNANPLLVKIMFLQLLHEVQAQLQQNEDELFPIHKYQHYQQSVIEVYTMMADRPNLNYSMRDFAERLNVSYSFFSRIFKAITGENFVTYASRLKLNYIKLQLMDTNKSVLEIAADCGFSDPNYLFIFFKREMGCTPNDYRILTARGRYGGK